MRQLLVHSPAARPRSARATRDSCGTRGHKAITHTTYYTPLADSVGIITPASLHFMQSHSRLPISIRKYSFIIHGLVDVRLHSTWMI